MAKKSYLTGTDQFCGAGGSSLGANDAGVEIRLALNHWELAIRTHNENFPDVDHDCADMSAVDPRRYHSTDFLITSPECTNHTIAKGVPRQAYKKDLFGNTLIRQEDERSRATMWDVPRFAEYHGYNIIVVENVVDAAKWRLWDSWLATMHALGYDHHVVYYNSMFAPPTPQSRDRLYCVFWKKGNKAPDLEFYPPAPCQTCGVTVDSIQTWKKKKRWGRYKKQYYYRCPTCHEKVTPYYYAAMNCIDWSIESTRIGDRKRPLKPKTIARIQYGLDTYGRQPLVVNLAHTKSGEKGYVWPGDGPLPTQTTCDSIAVALPCIVETQYSHAPDNRVTSGADPYPTATTRQSLALVAGFMTKNYGGDPASKSISLAHPAGTITTVDHHALLTAPQLPSSGTIAPAFIAELRGNSKAKGIDDPLMCITTSGAHHALISSQAFLTYYYGTNQASGMGDPIATATTKDRAALVGVLDSMNVDDLTFRMLQPNEIGKAMAFPDSYIIHGTKKQQVKQLGNAVTPPVMQMIIERCVASLQ